MGLRPRRWALSVLVLCAFVPSVVHGYLLGSHMYWERVGATPQFVSVSNVGCYNGPCGKNTADFVCNSQCGNLTRGVADTGGTTGNGWPRNYLLRFVLTLVIDRALWTNVFLTSAPTTGQTWLSNAGLLCYDVNRPLTSPNCLSPQSTPSGPSFLVMNVSTNNMVYLQWTKMFDYNPGNSLNGAIYTAGAVPQNMTAGYNYTSPRYPPCWSYAGNPATAPTCFCFTRDCSAASELASSFPSWTLETRATFNSNAAPFVSGVAPVINHHSPRLALPPIVYVPFMLVGQNVTWQLTAVDEDGVTVPTFSGGVNGGGTGVVDVTATGRATVGPLGERSPNPPRLPINSFYDKNYLFRARVTAFDNVIAGQPLTSTMNFMVKSCGQGGAVPLNDMWDASGLYVFVAGSEVTPVFVEVGAGRCVFGGGLEMIVGGAPVLSSANCTSLGGTFESSWLTPAQRVRNCTVGAPCIAVVTAVVLDFSTVTQCRWSGVAGGAVRCATLIRAGVGAVIDTSEVLITGEHLADVTSAFANPATARLRPFSGRASYPNAYEGDIGRKDIFCLTAVSNSSNSFVSNCPSTPFCVVVQTLGRKPRTLTPLNSSTCPDRTATNISQYLAGQCPDLFACAGADTPTEITVQAADDDQWETVNIIFDPITTLNQATNAAGYSASLFNTSTLVYPANAPQSPTTDTYCTARTQDPSFALAQVLPVVGASSFGCNNGFRKITFNLDFADTGRSPLSVATDSRGYRYVEIGDSKMLCYTISDNQQAVWGRGLSNSFSRCHIVRMRSAPIFELNTRLPLDSPFGYTSPRGLGAGEATLSVRVGQPVNFTMRARDPNPENTVKVLFMQDPGLPLDAEVSDSTCVDNGTRSNIQSDGIYRTYTTCAGQGSAPFCPTFIANCSESFRQVLWTPQPGSEGKTFRVCAIAKNDKGFCATSFYRRNPACVWSSPTAACLLDGVLGASASATSLGYYSTQLCVNLRVVPPTPVWDNGTVPTENGTEMFAHVGCESRWKVSASDVSYNMHVVVDSDTPLPVGASVVPIQSGPTSYVELRWKPTRGTEGSSQLVCFRAYSVVEFQSQLDPQVQEATIGSALPRLCMTITVRRCKYCVETQDTLMVKMKEFSLDVNWLRLWAANGNDDGDPLTVVVEDPGVLSTGLLDGVENGQVLNIGPIYRLQAGETLMAVAARFRTTVKILLDLNPDIVADNVMAGQEVCMIPCTS